MATRIQMILEREKLIHVPDASHYNYNVYELPIAINGNTHLLVTYDNGDEVLSGLSIGLLQNGGIDFQTRLWLNTFNDSLIEIDSHSLSEHSVYDSYKLD